MGLIGVVLPEFADSEDEFHISVNSRHSLIFQEKFLSLSPGAVSIRSLYTSPHLGCGARYITPSY
jgi:hypothetical protein